MQIFKDHEILVGTYEEYVLGYKLVPKLKRSDCELIQTFTCRGHSGPVRSITAGSKYVVSGGSDEVCKIYNMNERKEHGTLMHHDGTVTCLSLHDTTHLVTASEDHSLAILRTGNWQVEKTLYKHQAGITAMAVHPSGKLAFTAAKDKKLITWNLIKARPAFITNLKGIAEFIVVSPDGLKYAVGIHRRVDIYSVETAGVEYTIQLKGRPNCLVFLDNDTVVLGGEESNVQMHSLIEKVMIKTWTAHETRVRCLCLLTPDVKSEDYEAPIEGGAKYLVSGSSSDNKIKVWKVTTDANTEVELSGTVDTTCRITSMCVWHPGLRAINKKRKKHKETNSADLELAGDSVSPKKKVKISEDVASEKESKDTSVELIVETEETTPSQIKSKKKKKSINQNKKLLEVKAEEDN